MSKIVISAIELEAATVPATPVEPPSARPVIPLWARLVLLPLVAVLPLLAVVALVLRIALRASAPRVQHAWVSYLLALMVAGSLVFTAEMALLFSYFPSPPQAISAGMPELDGTTSFPELPSHTPMTGVAISKSLKPLVMVASPAGKRWFSRGETASGYVGAAVLIQATPAGFLFATAAHVAEGGNKERGEGRRVLLTTGHSGWAGAEVIAWHKAADLALLWMPRRGGNAEFAQPLAAEGIVEPGNEVYVIGHPEGLNFTISNGIISRVAGDVIQISAPVSPGNSGGPVYDPRGHLIGIVVAKLDRETKPNAENLNFAANSALLTRLTGWDFVGEGKQRFASYLEALKQKAGQTPGAAEGNTGR